MAFNASDIFKACEELLKFINSEQQYFSIEVYGTDNEKMADAKSLIEVLVSRGKILSSLTFILCKYESREFIELLECIRHARSVVFKKPLATENIEKLVSVLQGAENLRSLTFEEDCDLTPEMNELLAPHLKTISEVSVENRELSMFSSNFLETIFKFHLILYVAKFFIRITYKVLS